MAQRFGDFDMFVEVNTAWPYRRDGAPSTSALRIITGRSMAASRCRSAQMSITHWQRWEISCRRIASSAATDWSAISSSRCDPATGRSKIGHHSGRSLSLTTERWPSIRITSSRSFQSCSEINKKERGAAP